MAVQPNQVGLFYSGADYLNAIQGDPSKSLGNFVSSVLVSNGSFNNLFDELGFYELQIGSDNYRCIYVVNQSTTDTMNNLSLYTTGQQAFETISFGVSQPANNTSPVQLLNSQYDVPYNVSFYSSSDPLNPIILIPSLPPLQMVALWLLRSIPENTLLRGLSDSLLLNFNWI